MINHHLWAWRGIGYALLILALAALASAYVLSRPTPSNDRTQEASALVKEFGTHLKEVPLLADPATLSASMDTAYSPYVAPELLALWKADASVAPGRLTSSPWPERIEVASATKQEDGSYQVEANVIEVANGSNGTEEVSRYPASVKVEERAGKLLITSFQKSEYASLPGRMVVEGEYVCLPHRNSSGPQTMECAFGLKSDDGLFYGLDFGLLSSTGWMDLATGSRVRVEGPYAVDNGSSNYKIEGIISVTSFQEASE